MMAMRFRSMGMVAGVAVAALACYMVSLRVAAERFALVQMEGKVLSARQDIRRLQTEMGTRGRLVQLERWNSDILALSAPAAGHYLDSAFQLAAFARPQQNLDQTQVIETSVPASRHTAPDAASVQTVAYAPPPAIAALSPQPAQPLLRSATYLKPAVRVVPQKVSLLDDGLLGEIGRAASAEAASSHARR